MCARSAGKYPSQMPVLVEMFVVVGGTAILRDPIDRYRDLGDWGFIRIHRYGTARNPVMRAISSGTIVSASGH